MGKILVARPQDHMIIREGDEWVRKVFRAEKISFCTSTLGAGKSSTLDKGHENAEEICYVVKGSLVVYFPSQERYVELGPGDAVLIPPKEQHQIFNPGDETAESIWCAAPGTDFRPVKVWE